MGKSDSNGHHIADEIRLHSKTSSQRFPEPLPLIASNRTNHTPPNLLDLVRRLMRPHPDDQAAVSDEAISELLLTYRYFFIRTPLA